MSNALTVLGIDGGATRGSWRLVVIDDVCPEGRTLSEGEVGPSNVRLVGDAEFRQAWRALPKNVDRVSLCMAGCVTDGDRARMRLLARSVWPHAQPFVGSDRDSAFYASFDDEGIVVMAGTGSAIEGRSGAHVERAGGRGHLLGDRGSSYQIALDAIQATLEHFDLERVRSPFAEALLRKFCLRDFDEVVLWASQASKAQIASLASEVVRHAVANDAKLYDILKEGAQALAQHAHAVALRLKLTKPSIRLTGGLFEHHEAYRTLFLQALSSLRGDFDVRLAENPAVYGAVRYALKASPVVDELATLATATLVDRFLDGIHDVQTALYAQREAIESCADLVAHQLKSGGRLIYVGAGTSGRLGVLDASEIPPTFGVTPDLISALIAGGDSALRLSAEGAEDDTRAAREEMRQRKLESRDVVCGIAASGTTPFVLAALEEARNGGASTVFLTCNPGRPNDTRGWTREVDLATGPEIIDGSTRLKAGTATKILLNLISTVAMIRLGKVQNGFMVDMKVSNRKLRERAIDIVRTGRSCTRDEAERALVDADWNVRRALST